MSLFVRWKCKSEAEISSGTTAEPINSRSLRRSFEDEVTDLEVAVAPSKLFWFLGFFVFKLTNKAFVGSLLL